MCLDLKAGGVSKRLVAYSDFEERRVLCRSEGKTSSALKRMEVVRKEFVTGT